MIAPNEGARRRSVMEQGFGNQVPAKSPSGVRPRRRKPSADTRSLSFSFGDDAHDKVGKALRLCVDLRDKYKTEHTLANFKLPPSRNEGRSESHPLPPFARDERSLWGCDGDVPGGLGLQASFCDGVLVVDSLNNVDQAWMSELGVSSVTELQCLLAPLTLQRFYEDHEFVCNTAAHGPMRTHCWKRLELLKARFEMYKMEHGTLESEEQKLGGRDFTTIMKVDNHVHHAASMNHSELLGFMRLKLSTEGDQEINAPGQPKLTLRQLFHQLNLSPDQLSLDALDMQVDPNDAYRRFDRFNASYNPFGAPTLRQLFLKTNNAMGGRYFAELTNTVVLKNLERIGGVAAEYRLSVYGRSASEWEDLAAWVVDHKIFSPYNRWLIQVPRLFGMYRKQGILETFQDMLENLFRPLIDATLDPRAHPKLHAFLQQVVGIDSVDDESMDDPSVERKADGTMLTPGEWDRETNPPYWYYSYFLKANLLVVNRLRMLRGMRPLAFRPHCGEAGSPNHLVSGFLLAEGINHGIQLHHIPVIQYLMYLVQLPISMSPVSNNALFLPFPQSPFRSLFRKGLNVALSTDDPCLFHLTHQPLHEEFSIAAKVFRLTSVDLCELARNSVLQSGFEECVKRDWLGDLERNDICKSNVPNLRLEFRREILEREKSLLFAKASPKASPLLSDQHTPKLTPEIRSAAAGMRAPPLQLERLPPAAVGKHPPASRAAAAQPHAAAPRNQWWTTVAIGFASGAVASWVLLRR